MANLYILALLVLSSQLLPPSDAYRLPTIVTPYHYEVHLNISSSAFTASGNSFTGTAVIYFNVTGSTSEIKFHASSNFISITDIQLNNVEVPTSDYSRNSTTDILTISLNSSLEVETVYALKINYLSLLSTTDMYGFYKSSYVDARGVTKYLATTQFEPTYARRAFPCWDEPSFKATFSILITYPSHLNVLSNTPGTIRTNDTLDNLITIEFDKSPVMSSYLVAFIVSEFTCTAGDSIDSTPYRVCSRPETEAIRGWSVEIGPKILASLNEYTDYNYSLAIAKMDQVAIPDFAAGAMENWGLVTYRETGLLWDPVESSNSAKQSIAAVIAHEFTHMWFGNLVTCNWWSVTFLNEGFAQLLQYAVLDHVLPDWELNKQFIVALLHGVLDADSYLNAQALESQAETPSEINSKFGTITYSKGASVLRMVQHTMGYTNFRDGLRSYLREHQYSSTIPQDLWTSLSLHVNNSVTNLPNDLNTVMQNWIETSGYPLLTATVVGRVLHITQERFLLSGSDTTSKWYVPVTYTASFDSNKFEMTTPVGWLTPTSDLTITLQTTSNWIILNNQQSGYYRVNYDPASWLSIAAALAASNFSGIPEENRAQIIDDLFNLAKVNKIEYSLLFDVLEFLQNDISYFSWYPAFNGFSYLIGRIGEESILGRAVTKHLSRLMVNLYQSVPVTNLNESNQIYTLKQVSAVNWACRLGLEDCVSDVKNVFSEYKANGTRPNKNLKSIVYCNALRYSDDDTDWEFLWQTYLSTELATERATLISALGCTKNVKILNEYLAKSIDPNSGIRSQDAYSVFAAVYQGNAVGVDVAFNFLIQNHQAIDDYYQSMNSLANLMSGIASRFRNQNQITQLQNFIATGNLSESFLAAATQSLATAQANIEWINTYKNDLDAYYGITLADEVEDEIDRDESTLAYYRLSTIFQPSHYEVHLNTTRDAFTASGNSFSGAVVIYFNTSSSTTSIRLNARVQIQSVELNNELIPSENYTLNSTTDILTISYPNGLIPGKLYGLRITYTGTFGQSDLRGFYKSSYVNAENVTTYLLATQFEPVHARRAFPCFDEPSFKATFQVIITYPSELNVKSNTIGTVVQTDQYLNMTTVQFNKTPVMSTYLVAFVISDFTCTQGDDVDAAPHHVCSRDNQKEYRDFAVEVGSKLLASLNAYTGYNYSRVIEKMDQFAIPDFAAGAMENWGLVTYREPNLLWDPLVSTNSAKQSVATVIAHEFTHMWFGNLVTCKWWSEIFLNEGFARYFQYIAANDVLPDWELDKQFVVSTLQSVLSTDSYLTSQAIQSPASTPTDISNKFGTISYSKGASIFHMVKHFMGAENFRAALQHYLRTHQFSNTKPEQLWTILNNHIDPNITHLPTDLETVMENWIKKSGFPVLYVQIVTNNIVISQERFLLSGIDTSSKWYVPISYTTSVDSNKFESTAPRTWLTPTTNLRVNYPTGAQWVILNSHQTSFYRVQYSNDLWDALAVALSAANFSGIPELNRAQIADDVFEFLKVDTITHTRAFRVLEFLENDVSYFPWYPVISEFNNLLIKLGFLSTRIGTAMHAHVRQLVSNFYESVPLSVIDEDNHLYTLRQNAAVSLACRLGQPTCVEHIREIYYNYSKNGVPPPKNLQSVVYCNGIRHTTDRSDWDDLWETYKVTDLSSERSLLLSALGCTNDPAILWDYLTKSINADSGIRRTDSGSVFNAVYGNPVGVDVAVKFVTANHRAIYTYFQSNITLGNIITNMASRIVTEEELSQLQALHDSGVLSPQITNTVINAIALARQNLDWIEKYRRDFHEYYGLPDETTTTPTTTTTTTTSVPITTPSTPTTPGGTTAVGSSVVLVLVVAFIITYFK